MMSNEAMNKTLKTILIISAIISSSFLLTNSVQAQGNLVVEFENQPLFSEASFLPGQSVSRWVKVTNNDTEAHQIATEAINISDPDNFGDVLHLEIKEGSIIYFNDTLSNFFSAGEVLLSNLSSGNQSQYDFIVTFEPGTGNSYQGRELGFDILVGSQGTEGGPPPSSPPAGPGLPPGLTINEEISKITGGCNCPHLTATITWQTNYFSTSAVIYDTIPGQFDLSQGDPSYGYTYYKLGDDSGQEKVLHHVVTLVNLLPNTTYYYRVVSHASPATISREFTFSTHCRVLPPEEETGPVAIMEPAESVGSTGEKVNSSEEINYKEQEKQNQEKSHFTEASPKEEKISFSLLASIGSILGKWADKCLYCLPLWFILLLSLYPLAKTILAFRGKKKKEEATWFICFLVLLASTIIFYLTFYRCVATWFILILALITLLISRFFSKKRALGI